nr:Unconventional myosin-XVB like [Ipomoea batatas]
MPAVWLSLKKSLQCRSEPAEVHDPSLGDKKVNSSGTRKKTATVRSGCSRSIANLRDVVINGSRRYNNGETPYLQSPRSIGSNELLNPITHEVVLNNSTCELKITSYSFQDGGGGAAGGGGGGGGWPFVQCTLKPGTPGPGRVQYRKPGGGGVGSPTVKGSSGSLSRRVGAGFSGIVPRPKASNGGPEFYGFKELSCPKCGEHFSKWDAVESHHLSKHAVTQLVEGDSSRSIVEMICRTSWTSSKPDKNNNSNGNNGMERILKVHNMQKTLARFEEYRETVKIKASKLAKKHARCLADGNELLRFHGTTVECSLGKNGSSSLCNSEKCQVCQILRHGFRVKKGGVGVFTASTSRRAVEAIEMKGGMKRALIELSGFDSLAGKFGLHSSVEELFLLNPKALLPCFVDIHFYI